MTSPVARGACPRLSEPMQTGDGLLGAPRDGRADSARSVHRASARRRAQHGNGIIEISARGSLQVRGLTPLSAPLFAEDVTVTRHRALRGRAGDRRARCRAILLR